MRLQGVLDLIELHKQKWSLPSHVRVVVSYEAGQDGFWILRALSSAASTVMWLMPRAFRWSATSGARKQTGLTPSGRSPTCVPWLHGERVVRAPSMQDEALRHLIGDCGQLHKEVLQHRERMRKLLVTLGCWNKVDHKSFARRLAAGQLTCHNCTPLPDKLRERLLRETARLELAKQTLAALERTARFSPKAIEAVLPWNHYRQDLASEMTP